MLWLLAAVNVVSATERVYGSGNVVSQQRAAAPFLVVDARSFADVIIEQGDTYTITVTADDNLIDGVLTTVRGDHLLVDSLYGWEVIASAAVRITVPRLDGVRVNGSGDIVIRELQGDLLRAEVNGSGDLRAAGAVQQAAVAIRGSGDADLRQLSADDVTLRAAGTGTVQLGAVASLDVDMLSTGVVVLDEDVAVRRRGTGNGNVIRR